MNEVEKLYELAEVNKKCTDKRYEKCTGVCYDCKYFIYPSFTAEKQIEIIKFLIGKHARFDMFKDCEQKDLYMVYYECRYFPKQYLPFEEALAESINHLWQELTEEEKKQVKGILE